MNVLLTGAVGNIGLATANTLHRDGHQVLATDIFAKVDIPEQKAAALRGIQYAPLDIRSFDAVVELCRNHNIDTIVHLAAIPHYIEARTNELFHINVGGTYNIYEAAEKCGIKKVVSASSINWLGNGFGHHWIDVNYLPIDEGHPGFVTDQYAYSKQILEETAKFFWHRAGIASLCIRFPLVYNPRWLTDERILAFHQKGIEDLAFFQAMPSNRQREEIEKLKADFLAVRSERIHGKKNFFDLMNWMMARQGGMLMWGYENFWAWMHVNDAGRFLSQAIDARFEGVHPLYVAEGVNCLGLPARDLIDIFFPNTPLKRPIDGCQSLLDTTQVETILTFEYRHSVAALLQ